MALRYRPMRSEDVDECVKIIAEHPVIGPRYGPAVKDLGPALRRVANREAAVATVFEETRGSRSQISVFGVTVCVSDDFVRELKTAPLFWFGPRLATRIARGDSPLLSDQQFREANSRGGLNRVVWEGCFRVGIDAQKKIYGGVIEAFIELHRGYFLKEIISSQLESPERLQWTLATGGLLWSPETNRYESSPAGKPEQIVREPHIIGITRETSAVGAWMGALFVYDPPKLGFSRSEQQLLLAALDGITDQELAERLRLSLPAVKKKWSSIYNRVGAHLPDLLPHSLIDDEPSQRGKEKRRPLLIYLREHPEELRPVSRKLLKQPSNRRGPFPSKATMSPTSIESR